MSKKQTANKKVIERAIVDVLNHGEMDLVDELFAQSLVEHDPHKSAAPTAREAFKMAVNAFRSAFPDNRMTIDGQIAEGDMVSTRWTMRGTHGGEFLGVAPSGQKVVVTGIFFDRLEEGKIVETWANYDLYGLMQQIGGSLEEMDS